jgi:hypothetical protein
VARLVGQERAESTFDAWCQRVQESGVPALASFSASLVTDEAAVLQALKAEVEFGLPAARIICPPCVLANI